MRMERLLGSICQPLQTGIACDDFISVQADLLHCGCLAGSKTC